MNMNTTNNKIFKFNINEQVFIKGDWKTVYNVLKCNGRKYQLQTDDGFIDNIWYHDNQLTNTRKSEFLTVLRETKLKFEQEQLENQTLAEVVLKDTYQYINWEAKNRPCKVLFTNGELAPKRVFYWIEEDYAGSIFTVYEYKYQNKLFYLCLSSGFGSCSGCDGWEHVLEIGWCGEDNTQEKHDYILREYNRLYVEIDKKNILNNKYIHPELKQKLTEWTNI
jgi:hypothetical protein